MTKIFFKKFNGKKRNFFIDKVDIYHILSKECYEPHYDFAKR